MRASTSPSRAAALAVFEQVRCLECGCAYSKPAGGGTVAANPGCPDCGYVGWLPAAVPVSPRAARRHSGADLPRRLSPRSR